MAAPHAFLDILANAQVRDAYLTGRIAIILSPDLAKILWANGTGARFMGFRTVAESINVESGFDRLTCHQIEAGLSGTRPVRIRGIPQAQSFLVHAITIEQLGQVVFLRSVASSAAENGLVDLTDGLSDETTEAAVLDLSGQVMRASPDFDPHLLATEELAELLQQAHRDGEVKKRFLSENKDLPVGVLQLCDDPAIFLLIAAKSDTHRPAAPRQQPFVFQPDRLPQRFVWKIDAQGRFTEVSPELEKIVGRTYSGILGCSFVDIATDWNMDRDGAVRALLHSRNAWSGRTLDWPVEEDERRVSVELAALPVYAQDRTFAGFRGFGVINAVVISEAADNMNNGKTVTGGLTPQEHEAFSAIARQLKADMFAVEDAQQPETAAPATPPVPEADATADNTGADNTGAERSVDNQAEPAPLAAQQAAHSTRPRGALLALEQLPLAVLVYRDTQVLFVNQAFLDLTGYASADALRQSGVMADIVAEWIAQGCVRLMSGDSVALDGSASPLVWEDGEPAAMICCQRPGTDAAYQDNKAELEALQYKSGQLAALLNLVSDGIIILDSAGIVASANETAARIFGFTTADINGQLFSRFFSEKSLATIGQGFQAAMDDSHCLVAGKRYEGGGVTTPGNRLKMHVYFWRVGVDDGYFFLVRDMTRFHAIVADLIRERSQAEDASQKKSRYLALISHEIRTPLNAVIGLSQLMHQEKFGPLANDRYRDYLADIVRSGEHIMTLINDLLHASKSEAGWMKLDIRPQSLPVILNEVLGLMMPQANANQIIIRSGVGADLPSVMADTRSVRQILLNLLSNAIRFTPKGGQIVISADHQQPDEILLRIRDSGIGMSPSELQEAMRPYRQVRPSENAAGDNDAAQGTGLGLPLTKAIAEANQARFTLQSEPGKGTVAELIFKAAAPSAAAAS